MDVWKKMPEQQKGASLPAAEVKGEDGSELGSIRVHNNVIAIIARLTALKVPGVLEMSGSFAEGLANMMSKSSFDRGIRVEVEDRKINLELNIVLEFGVRIPQVAWQIQNDVRKAVEEMTGQKVGAVNVVVQSVKYSGAALSKDQACSSSRNEAAPDKPAL